MISTCQLLHAPAVAGMPLSFSLSNSAASAPGGPERQAEELVRCASMLCCAVLCRSREWNRERPSDEEAPARDGSEGPAALGGVRDLREMLSSRRSSGRDAKEGPERGGRCGCAALALALAFLLDMWE